MRQCRRTRKSIHSISTFYCTLAFMQGDLESCALNTMSHHYQLTKCKCNVSIYINNGCRVLSILSIILSIDNVPSQAAFSAIVRYGSIRVVELFLPYIQSSPYTLSRRSAFGCHITSIACVRGKFDILELLTKHGAPSPSADDLRYTPAKFRKLFET